MSDRTKNYIRQFLAEDFAETLKGRKASQADKVEELLDAVASMLDSVSTVHFRNTHLGVSDEIRNNGDLNVSCDANGHIAHIEAQEAGIIDIEFYS